MIYRRKSSPFWQVAFYVRKGDKLVKKAVSSGTRDRDQALAIERHYRAAIAEVVSKRKAERFVRDVAEAITGEVVPRAGFPLGQVWDRAEAIDQGKRRSERSIESKRADWLAFLRWVTTERSDYCTMDDITRRDARAYMEGYASKSASRFNNVKHNLSAIWTAMMVDADLKENPWAFAGTGGSGYVSYRTFSHEELLAIMAAAGEGFWRIATATGFYTGLRLTDIVHLSADQFEGEYIVLKPRKTARKGKKVYIFVHPQLRRILPPVLATADGHLWPDVVHRYSTTRLGGEYSTILKAAGVRDNDKGRVGFHSLRSSFITAAEQAGVDRRIVQGVGHGSPLMTARYNQDTTASRILETALPNLLTEG